MPPKAKISKEMILNTVLDITRESGFETVNARSIANKLQCSTRPIFTCYENMEELKKEFLTFAYEYYKQYVIHYQTSAHTPFCLLLPLSYLEFADREPHLFKLLFVNDMDLMMTDERNAERFSASMGLEPENGKVIFLDLFLYTHGIAVLTVTKKTALNRETAEKMLRNVLSAFIK